MKNKKCVKLPRTNAVTRASALALALLIPASGASLAAQISTTPPANNPAPQISAAERAQLDAQAMLTSALTRIGTDGNDVSALVDAGTAANILGDAQAAYGFLNRARSIAPNNGRVMAGLGVALVRLENPVEALRMFDQAVKLGTSERGFLAERAMAYDLIGDNAKAQRDYQMALQVSPNDQTLRNYALSLGIGGETDRAIQIIAPLLQRKDRAAWRDRAFILAMNGRTQEAVEIVRTTMPANVASGLTPYLTKMNRLSNRQMALAVHYGQFPTSDAQLAAVGRNAGGNAPAAASSTAAKAAPARGGRQTAARQTSRNTSKGRSATPVAAANDPLAGKRFVDEDGRPVKLSRSEQLALLKEHEEKQAEAARQAEAKRVADANAAQAAAQAEAARQAEATRQAAVAREAEIARQAEAARQAETARLAQQRRDAEAARLAAAKTQRPPVQTAMANAPQPQPQPQPQPPAQVASAPVSASPMGPVDSGARAISAPPAAAPAPAASAVVTTDIPASSANGGPVIGPGFTDPVNVAPVTTPAPLPAATAPTPAVTSPESTFKAFSLDDLVKAVRPPEVVRTRTEAPVDTATLERLRQDKLRADREAAAARRAEADKKRAADAQAAKDREAAATAAAEAAKKKDNPARTWVQIATGAANVMGSEYRRQSAGKNATIFKEKSGYTAPFGRSQRLLVGPFDTMRDANSWLASFKKNGGDGFVWTSDTGEEVTPVGRR